MLRHVLVSRMSRDFIPRDWGPWIHRTSFHWVPPYPFVFTLLLFSASCIAKCLITPDYTRTERRQEIASRTMPRQGNITKIVKQHNDRMPGQRREAFIAGVPIFVQNLIAATARLLLNVGWYRCPHGINFHPFYEIFFKTPFFIFLNLFGKILRNFWVRKKGFFVWWEFSKVTSALVHVLSTTVSDETK